MNHPEINGAKSPLWSRILGLVEEDLAERRGRKLLVEVRGEFGPYEKEIGELSPAELRSLDPEVGERVREGLLDRYLAEQGRVDLIERRRAYTKRIRDLTSADVPALIEADRFGAEECLEEREREEFIREVRDELDRLLVRGAKMGQAESVRQPATGDR